ncbi:unnamed protein product [Prorocentrum cordatum]|uniref:Kinesin light chain n=1 Tax=Prorocentrum cordatum TaxID=2364126 RepID=A0ABN9RLX3_9DINO|nr:unnamed protein product [Polarella glacialis]
MRRGPGAMTRAWCMFEMVKALAKPARLHVVLSHADVNSFEELLTKHFDDIAGIVAGLDARKAQVSKPEDRDYILGQVRMVDGGLGTVTSTVCSSLRGWLAEQGRKVLQSHHEDNGEQNIIRLKHRVAKLLKAQGDLAGAEPLLREALQASREVLGDRHPDTLTSVNDLAMRLQAQGDLAGAEPLLREALQANREVLGDRQPNTLTSPLFREALQARREVLSDRRPRTLTSVNNLAMVLQDQGTSPAPSRSSARRCRRAARSSATGTPTRSPRRTTWPGCWMPRKATEVLPRRWGPRAAPSQAGCRYAPLL